MRPALLLTVLLAGVLSNTPAFADVLPRRENPGVQVLASGPSSLRLSVDVPAGTLEPLPGDAGQRVLAIEGFPESGTPGGPGRPARILRIAVPPTGEVRVRGVASGGTSYSEVRLAPAPQYAKAGDELVPTYTRDEALYRAPRPAGAARLLSVTWLREQRVANIEVDPTQYDAGSGELRVAARVEVEVEFAVDPAASPGLALAEPVDPFEAVYRSALVNYEQGRRWRRTRGTASLFGTPSARTLSTIPQDTLFAGRAWARLAIPASGFYKVNYGQLRNLAAFSGVDTIRLDQIRMVAWRGFPYLSEVDYCDTCGYREVAIQFVSPDEFSSSNANEIYFYALGANDWQNRFDPALSDSEYVNHPYDTQNVYYLTVTTPTQPFPGTPRRIPALDLGTLDIDGSETVPVTFPMRVHREQDLVPYPNLSPKASSGLNAGYVWEKFFWAAQQINRDFPSDTISTPGVDRTQAANIRMRLWGISATDTCYTPVYYGNHLIDVSINGTPLPREGWNGNIGFTYHADASLDTFNTVRLRIPAITGCFLRADQQAYAWYELRYPRRFEPVGDELAFDSPSAPGDYAYRIGPFANATAPRLFDITDPFEPAEIVVGASMYQDSAGARWLRFEVMQAGPRRYQILQSSSIAPLPNDAITGASLVSLDPLRGAAHTADYVVIYYDPFKAAADELVAWRANHLPKDAAAPYQALAFPVSAIYDQFSGGRIDPGAIRQFLRAAFYNWAQPPAFVTLLGDASYDYKNVLKRAVSGQTASPVPTFENGFSLGLAFATDDWVLNVNDPYQNIPDFFGGRIPVNTASEALDFVRRKVIAYEQSAPLGAWRNELMLIADDDKQGEKPDGLDWHHVQQTSVADSTWIPPHIDREYVYLHKYPDGPGATKPEAKDELKANVNAGLLLFNFIGHGSPFKLADETVLLDVDAGTFTNATEQAIFVAASCDVGKFSNPQVQSLGERMLLATNGGAVAVVSATEEALSQFNANLLFKFFQAMFTRAPVSGQYRAGIAEALLVAKNGTVGQVDNNSKYGVLGDSGTPFNLPRRWADVQLYACDTCSTPLTELKAGQLAVFRGAVVEAPGGPPVAMNGVADLLIEDNAPLELVPRCTYDTLAYFCSPSIRPYYYYRAGTMYRGDARITNGTFSGSFVVPAEAARGARGRVRAYVQGTVAGEPVAGDGVGSIRAQVSNGEAAPGDSTGPSITLSFEGGATAVRSDATLHIDLFDVSGILTTGHSPQNGIIVTLDNNSTARKDITSSFRYLTGSHQSGAASFTLPGIARGPHTISVSAADNLAAGLTAGNHRSSATLAFEVSDVPPLTIDYAYLFPNPTRSGGTGSGGSFVVDARGDSLNALLRIYTVSGKLVRSLTRFGGIGQVQLPWDGLDAEGQRLANGVYFFRIQVNVRDEQGKSSPRQSASTEGRFVIVN